MRVTYLKHSKDGKHFAHFIGMHHFGDHRSEHGGRGGVKDSNEATNIEHPLIDSKGKEQQVDDCCESICKEKRRIFIEVTDPQCVNKIESLARHVQIVHVTCITFYLRQY